MFSLNNVVLPESLASKFTFLHKYNIEFGKYLSAISGDKWTIVCLFGGFALVLLFKNSMQKLNNFHLDYKTAIFAGILFITSILLFSKVSEFLYFNF